MVISSVGRLLALLAVCLLAPQAVCVPSTAKKKTSSYLYSTRDTLKCFPRPRMRCLSCLLHKDPNCSRCGAPVSARVLIKKKVVKESTVTTCEPLK